MMRLPFFLLALGLTATPVSSQFTAGTPVKEVIDLGPTIFTQAIQDTANPLWLLKFYAPWCGHCKKMAPILDKLAPILEGQMAIGKIDCTVHKPLCNEYKVRGYPTMKFSLDGDIHDYPAGRDENAILSFAKKMSAPSVTHVANYDQAIEFAKSQTEEGVAFLGYDPTSTSELPSALHQIFSQAARKKQASAYFLWLDDEAGEGESFVHRIEADVKSKAWNKDELTTETLMQFIKEQNVPLVATMGPNNFHRIGNNGRPLVMSVVDMGNDDQTKAVKARMIDYIDQAKDPDQYYYGIIDGKKWGKFLEQFRVAQEDNPQTIILEVPTKKFWQNATYSNLFEFMKAVEDGTLASDYPTKGNNSGATGLLGKVERAFLDYFPYSLGLLLLLVFAFVFLLVPTKEDLRPRYVPQNDEDQQEEEEKGEEEKEEEDTEEEPQESKKEK